MLSKIKIKIYQKYLYLKSWYNTKLFEKRNENEKRIFLIDTPSHGNLGDHAIAWAEREILSENFPDYQIVEISEDDFNEQILPVKRKISSDDIVVLSGGGNLGDEYILDERIRRKTIRLLKNNPIIIFPQTIHFLDTINGKVQTFITKRIYNRHKRLIICLREQKSYDIAKKMFPACQVICVPDAVLYMNISDTQQHGQNDIVLMLRKDKESIVTSEMVNSLQSELKTMASKLGKHLVVNDTVVPYQVNKKERDEELGKLFNVYFNAGLVVTDRLHGMIISAITGTPCIVLSNFNHKVKGVYELWLKNIDYIQFCSEDEEIKSFLKAWGKNCFITHKYEVDRTAFEVLIEEMKKCKVK